MHDPCPPTAPLTRSHDQYQSITSLVDISQIISKFREIIPPSHCQGNCIPFAAIRWHVFGNRPALGRPFGHFSRHSDTPLLSFSPGCPFPRPTPERVFVAMHRSAADAWIRSALEAGQNPEVVVQQDGRRALCRSPRSRSIGRSRQARRPKKSLARSWTGSSSWGAACRSASAARRGARMQPWEATP